MNIYSVLCRKGIDFAQKYNSNFKADEKAEDLLCLNEWRVNIRHLRNIVEQMSY